ncbi:hypothetical protein [Paenibacillus sp. CCS19]|uniref:hypothetical protein n=1 Tax=Paenibacillus sp. CCS19 TaxID=3158387 RepID=UPI00295E958F|nr:hypothetical protein [Paenibacillus cellulosilyticus]
MRKILFYLVLFGCLTACSDSSISEDNSASVIHPTEPIITPIEKETVIKDDNNPAPTKVDNDKSINKTDESNSKTKDIISLIPTGWHILESGQPVEAEGDLNKDGIQDIAIAIEKTTDVDARSILIAFGTEDHAYELSIIADHVVLSELEGGPFGDPFNGLMIDRGSVVVSDYGGGSGRWFHKYRFRYQENDWYLIGATMGSNHSIKKDTEMVFDTEDYNLLTGDYIIDTTNENGEEKITKGNRGKKKLVRLSEFNIDDM